MIRWNIHALTNTDTLTHATPHTAYLEQLTFFPFYDRTLAILWTCHLAHTCNYWYRYNSCQMTFCPILFGSLDKNQFDKLETCRPVFLPKKIQQGCIWWRTTNAYNFVKVRSQSIYIYKHVYVCLFDIYIVWLYFFFTFFSINWIAVLIRMFFQANMFTFLLVRYIKYVISQHIDVVFFFPEVI